MVVSKYFVWFVLFSFMGWIYESIYCTLKKHHWENRGFLFGPICPIYGVGAVAATIVCSGAALPEMSDVKIFFVCFFGSIVLEYTTSWVLEKLFHAVWWDYSNVKFNIHGRVCLPASIGFGAAGLLVVHIILPFTQKATSFLSPLAMEIVALFLMAILAADTALTVSALTSLMQNLQTIEAQVNRQMQELYANFEENFNEKKEELTNASVRSMTRLLNLGQRHALHSVKEFHYEEHTMGLSRRLMSMEAEIRQKAAEAKKAAKEKTEQAKKTAKEKTEQMKEHLNK